MTETSRLETFFREHAFFSDLPAETIHELAGYADVRALAIGEELFREGEPGHHLYWIVDGSIKFATVGRTGRSVVLNILEAPAMFGEIALLDDGPRTATASAVMPTIVIAVRRERLFDYLDRYPAFSRGLIRLLCDRLRYVAGYVQASK